MNSSSLPNIIAIDLGAESCRVSLLQWQGKNPRIELVHRFPNKPLSTEKGLFWDLNLIFSELERSIVQCGERAAVPLDSIGIDGWAVDYVRRADDGQPLGPPFCYRDTRTEATFDHFHSFHSKFEVFAASGVQPLHINTLYQLLADRIAGVPDSLRWVNLPEYVLAKLGGRFVAEFTNASHTSLLDIKGTKWNTDLFDKCGLTLGAAPEIVATGTDVGQLNSTFKHLPAFGNTRLIATACHDTASAVAAIPFESDDWGYISSGTWSLVGTLLNAPLTSVDACELGFTNLGAAGLRTCFHKNVNAMWILKQAMQQLCPDGEIWPLPQLIATAEALAPPDHLLNLDDPDLVLPGQMASRINAQRTAYGLKAFDELPANMPKFAALIFHSLAAKYAEVLEDVRKLTGKEIRKLAIVGGGSLNKFLNRLTAQTTGMEIYRGAAESSTIGNFAIQLATLERASNVPARIAHWARLLTDSSES